ncbi:unnamed protein product [Lactuca virosa]|uniref:Replication protein A OB domain-containing protein n=1 Tax=Lactuca virosa TaxID=75947 RepID=A0AAU9N0J7_9ASTR|nr:unnamed protein product [Lactuca virosa]
MELPRQQDKGPSTAYLDLGDCDQICEHCYACFWYAERRKDPLALWTKQWRRMSDDIVQRAAADSHVVNLHVNEVDLQQFSHIASGPVQCPRFAHCFLFPSRNIPGTIEPISLTPLFLTQSSRYGSLRSQFGDFVIFPPATPYYQIKHFMRFHFFHISASCLPDSTKMDTSMVANLNPGDGDKPIEIKVIRKWLSYGKKAECCYIFLDKSGDAIEACGCLGDKGYFDSIIKMDGCYSVSNYVCDNANTFFVTVPHKTKIKLGRAAKFEEIRDDGFPVYYFNFLAYGQLGARLDNHKTLTNYIGRVENVYEVVRTQGNAILKLKLENLSGTMIETTFWDEAANSFDKEVIEALPSPVIVAITSMKVTQYLGNLQLTATPASYIYINPTIPEAVAMAAEFVERHNQNPVLKIQYQKSKDVEVEKKRNRELSSLAKHLWFFITAHIADETAQAKIVFFDAAARMLFQTDCNTLIDHHGYTDLYTLPAPLTILIGQPKIIQFRFARFCRPGAKDFVADAVFEDIVSPEKESHTETDIINQPTTSPS